MANRVRDQPLAAYDLLLLIRVSGLKRAPELPLLHAIHSVPKYFLHSRILQKHCLFSTYYTQYLDQSECRLVYHLKAVAPASFLILHSLFSTAQYPWTIASSDDMPFVFQARYLLEFRLKVIGANKGP